MLESDLKEVHRPKDPEVPTPTCPYCRTKPARVVCSPFQLAEGVTAVTIFCANPACAKILAIQVVNVQAPRVELAQPSLVIPGVN